MEAEADQLPGADRTALGLGAGLRCPTAPALAPRVPRQHEAAGRTAEHVRDRDRLGAAELDRDDHPDQAQGAGRRERPGSQVYAPGECQRRERGRVGGGDQDRERADLDECRVELSRAREVGEHPGQRDDQRGHDHPDRDVDLERQAQQRPEPSQVPRPGALGSHRSWSPPRRSRRGRSTTALTAASASSTEPYSLGPSARAATIVPRIESPLAIQTPAAVWPVRRHQRRLVQKTSPRPPERSPPSSRPLGSPSPISQ